MLVSASASKGATNTAPACDTLDYCYATSTAPSRDTDAGLREPACLPFVQVIQETARFRPQLPAEGGGAPQPMTVEQATWEFFTAVPSAFAGERSSDA